VVSGETGRDTVPPVLRGSLITMRRRCGKPSCRCADGTALHEGPALSVSLSGRSVTVSLRPEQVPAVAAALARYRSARDALEAQANAGVAALRDRDRDRDRARRR
jgi:hypothetical protein